MECPLLRFLQNEILYGSNTNTGMGPKGSSGGEMLSLRHSFIFLCVKFAVKEALVTFSRLLHTNLLPPPDMCGSPDQAADYSMISVFKLGASSLSAQSADRGVNQFHLIAVDIYRTIYQ
jgi:hypothetical protein